MLFVMAEIPIFASQLPVIGIRQFIYISNTNVQESNNRDVACTFRMDT